MTPRSKKIVKTVAIIAGIALIVTAITILIVRKIQQTREEQQALNTDPTNPKATNPTTAFSTGSSLNTFQGRTFSTSEIDSMQSFLLNMGAMAMNDLMVSSIRDSGGIDGKIGTGFTTAYNEAIRIGLIQNLDDLYTQAQRFYNG